MCGNGVNVIVTGTGAGDPCSQIAYLFVDPGCGTGFLTYDVLSDPGCDCDFFAVTFPWIWTFCGSFSPHVCGCCSGDLCHGHRASGSRVACAATTARVT
jgi:hypothetical protein